MLGSPREEKDEQKERYHSHKLKHKEMRHQEMWHQEVQHQ